MLRCSVVYLPILTGGMDSAVARAEWGESAEAVDGFNRLLEGVPCLEGTANPKNYLVQ